MKKQHVIAVVFLFAIMIPMAVPLTRAADTLQKPTVTLPSSDWQLTTDNAYPTDVSEHDPAGAGLLEYANQNYDVVIIYYEKAPSTAYTSASLQAEAESIFTRDHSEAINSSGAQQFAGVNAGYAKGYDSSVPVYLLELVFVKGGYYFNVYAYYDANAQAESNVNSLINSIDVPGNSLLSGPMLYVIVGVVAAVVVIVVVVVVMRSRKKKPQQSAQPAAQDNFPPPPPSAPTT